MKPKQVMELIGVTRDRIKFYKREGLFTPENPPEGNKATNYTKTDIECLKFLEVLSKSGFTSTDIQNMQDGEMSLAETAKARMTTIEDDIQRKKNSLVMLSLLLADGAKFEEFDTDHYWNIIYEKEQAGEEFIDIVTQGESGEVPLTRGINCPACGKRFSVDLEEYLYYEEENETHHGMGQDRVYFIDTEESVTCPGCDTVVHVRGWIREYPLGAYDSENLKVEADVKDMEKADESNN